MTFDEWFDQLEDFEVDPYRKDTKYDCSDLLALAFEAGWDACRDQWGGLDYEQTRKFQP